MARRLRYLLADRKAAFGLVVLCFALLAALWPSLFASHNPLSKDLAGRLRPPRSMGEDGTHLLGTDSLGRDVLSRIIYASRVSLTIGFAAVVIATPLGVGIGLAAGYFGGWFDNVVMRIADVQLAFPTILLAIVFMAVFGQGAGVLVMVLGISGWVLYARMVRSSVLSVRESEFVAAARAIGATHGRIILLHVLPNVIGSVVVLASFHVAQVILLESTLSFLGLGVPPPHPTWGGMLSDSRDYIASAWWLGIFPGLAVLLVVLSINLVGDWLRDALDPRLVRL